MKGEAVGEERNSNLQYRDPRGTLLTGLDSAQIWPTNIGLSIDAIRADTEALTGKQESFAENFGFERIYVSEI